jgi:hypothetical protein
MMGSNGLVGLEDGMVLEKSMLSAEGRIRKLIKWMICAAVVIPRRQQTGETRVVLLNGCVKSGLAQGEM